MGPMGRLDGKLALITGAARGLGFAIASRFREEGADVIVNDLDRESAEKAAAELGGIGVAADVSDSDAVSRMFERIRADYGRLDILVNNAGISGVEHDPELVETFRARTLAQVAEIAAGGPVRTHLDRTVETSDENWRRVVFGWVSHAVPCRRNF